MNVEIKVLDARIKQWGLPRHQSAGAAGIDLYACLDQELSLHPQSSAELISAGIAIHIGDHDVAGLIIPRSGMGHRRGLVLGNLVGLLDPDYTGPVLVSAWNRNAAGSDPILVQPGDRIAQLVFVPFVRASLEVVEEFSRSSGRASGGFGSTGEAARGA